jgi:DNA repair protein RecO (recombination protein O)
MSLYRDHGIVLRTYKLGEADRIIVFVTKAHGKVRAVAKGVRKTRSKFGGRLEPTSHASLQLYEGRELDIVTQAESVDHFAAIRDDYTSLTRASAMLEAVDQVSQEREANPELYHLLLGALRTLNGEPGSLVVPAFFLKLLALEGHRPMLDACASCGSGVDLVAFDINVGGVLCRECRSGSPLSPEALALLRQILDGGLRAALDQPDSRATREVDHLATEAVEQFLERRLKSVPLIDV